MPARRVSSPFFQRKGPSLYSACIGVFSLRTVPHLREQPVQFSSERLFATPRTAARQLPSFTISRSLLKLMSIESVMPSNHLILCRPLLFLPSIFPSIRVFSSESVLRIRWPKDWSFSFIVSPSSEYSGLIFFWIDWFDDGAVREVLLDVTK